MVATVSSWIRRKHDFTTKHTKSTKDSKLFVLLLRALRGPRGEISVSTLVAAEPRWGKSVLFAWLRLRQVRIIASLIVLIGLTSCSHRLGSEKRQDSRTAAMTIEQALNHHTERLMSIPGVVGTAIGECNGRPCIMILVEKKTPDLMKKIPSTLEGFPVVVEETGVIRPIEKRKSAARNA
jgi:hypothetical protein